LSTAKAWKFAASPKMACQSGSHHAPDQVACHVAGDIGGERPGGFGSTACLAEIGERQRERGRHAEALRDSQQGEFR
jgi:hypothetical protein